jgi:hypothetical protein
MMTEEIGNLVRLICSDNEESKMLGLTLLQHSSNNYIAHLIMELRSSMYLCNAGLKEYGNLALNYHLYQVILENTFLFNSEQLKLIKDTIREYAFFHIPTAKQLMRHLNNIQL